MTTAHSTDPAGAREEPGPTSVGGRAARAPGETSDSPQRPPQRMHGTALAFDLEAQSDLLRQEASWQRGDRNAKTLVKEEGFRVVLVVMRAGARLAEHAAHGQATVQVLSGRVAIRLKDRSVALGAGELVALDALLDHEVEAAEESALLLTIGTA